MASPTRGQLTKKDQAVVQSYLSNLTHKWMEIGVELKVNSQYLEKLKKRHKLSEKDRFRKVISSWLKQKGGSPVPTWRSLCGALRTRAVGEIGIAECIQKEKDVEFELDELSQSIVPFKKISDDPNTDPCALEDLTQSQTASATQTILYPTNVTLQAPFPHLMTSGMSAKEKDSLFERLLQESSEIRLAFTMLESNTTMSLLSSEEVDGTCIHELLKSLNLQHHKILAGLYSTGEVMGNLNEFWSFFDYGLLEHVVQKFGTPTDRESLDKYKESLAEYSRRRLFECPANIGSPAKENEKMLVLKRRDRRTFLSDLTLNEVKIFSGIFKKQMDVDKCDMRLISYERDDQSLELRFAILSSVSADLFPLSDDKKEKLEYLDVWLLECEEESFQKDCKTVDVKELSRSEEIEHHKPEDKVEDITSDEPTVLFKSSITCPDEDIGTHTSIGINNKRIVVEVSSCSKSPYKSYKVSKQREGSLQWLSGAKGTRYGTGKAPKIALNDEGFVVEVDEETDGQISCRVGQIHESNMIIWTESSNFTNGSNPSITLSYKTVIVAFKRAEDAFYRIGMLNTHERSVVWSNKEHRFISGILDLAIASNQDDLVVTIYSKQMVTSALSPLYATVGTLNKVEKKILFSQQVRASPQSLSNGSYPSVALSRENDVIMVSTQRKTAIKQKVKYRLGSVKMSAKTNDFDIVWSGQEGTIDFEGKKASVAMNDKNSILISHSKDGECFCHIGKIYRETTI